MNSRSESRLRYLIASTFIESAYSSWAAQAERSARRQTVRATCRWAAGDGAAVEDERAQLGQLLVVLVAPALEPVDVVGLDPQRRVLRVLHHRGAEVGADVEQVVLHVGQHRGHVVVELAGRQHEADVGVGLVDVGVRLQPEVGLAWSRSCRRGGCCRRRRCACRCGSGSPCCHPRARMEPGLGPHTARAGSTPAH